MSLTSFFPKLLHHYHRPEDDSANMLYFGDIAKIGVKDFKTSIKERYLPSENETFSDAYLGDLAVQTAVQASIAARKFRTFNAAGRLVLASFICMAMPPIIWVIQMGWRLVMHDGVVAG